MGWYTMKYSDFCDLIEAYIKKVYNKEVNKHYQWKIEISTKKTAKNQLQESLYTLTITAPDGTLLMQSSEVPGSNKTRWNSEEAIEFLLTLQKPQR